jgi:uncharacterized protein YjbI with pentapeptide repeats
MAALQIFRPLQVGFNNQVLEQNRKFYFIVSATLGINLQTGEELLDLNYLKDVFDGMGENPLPDMGMPKPNGEFLVSGNFFPSEKQSVAGGNVKVRLGDTEKELYVFGQRKWQQGIPSKPDEIISMPLDYTKAFGGEGFDKNPAGIGYNDGMLPCIENPKHLVASKKDKPDPVGFSPLDPMLPQRMQYQGTYDADYKQKFFPGYPEDHNWKFFLCSPSDQWNNSYYSGNEGFNLTNMHPEIPDIAGKLPGLFARCFINQKKEDDEVFGELPLNLDTIWFFPEKLLGLLIFRGIVEVEDDEAETITHVLCGYESKSQQSRSLEYYKSAFEKRRKAEDAFLNNLNTQDLIPEGHKCAMELLMEMGAIEAGSSESALKNNMDAKAEAMQKTADDKIEEAIKQTENNMKDIDNPEQGKIDIQKMMKETSGKDPDPDVEEMNRKLETILPGISSNDPNKLDMRDFSSSKIEDIKKTVEDFSDKKMKSTKEMVNKELAKNDKEVKKQIETIDKQIDEIEASETPDMSEQIESLKRSKQTLSESLGVIPDIDFDEPVKSATALPRIDTRKVKTQMSQMDLTITESIQHLQSMKSMGVEDEKTKELEKQIQEAMDNTAKETEKGLKESQKVFKEGYLVGAHFMDPGLSPHGDESREDVKKRFFETISMGESVSGGDWACIDLSEENLDGVDLSGAFLEQVNFKDASLKNANFSNAILARANLEGSDLSGTNFENANIGAVHAVNADFTNANLKSARLSKGNFTNANFTNANLEAIESLYIGIDHANFTKAYLPQVIFIEINIAGAKFVDTDMESSAFIKCTIEESDFSESVLNKCAFVETGLKNVTFEKANLSNACFVESGEEKSEMENLIFRNACLVQANFQNMDMQKVDLTNTNLENALFSGANLSEADLSNAQAKNAQFRKTKLTKAKLDRINLDQGSLAKANLVNASLKGANLHAVDFLRSTITNTDFSGSNLEATLIEHWRPE